MALVGVLEDLWLTTAPGKYIGSTDQNDNIGLSLLWHLPWNLFPTE